MRLILKRLWREQAGDDLEEYALLLAVIALGVLLALTSFGKNVSKTYTSSGQALPSSYAGNSGGGSGGGQAGGGGSAGGGNSGDGSSQNGGQGSSGGLGSGGQGSGGGGAGNVGNQPQPTVPLH